MRIGLTQGRFAEIAPEDFERVSRHKWHASKDTSSAEPRWYAYTNLPKKPGRPRTKTSLHRFVMNARPGEEYDHKDHDGLNCRKSNLRLATCSQNQGNRRSMRGSSRYKGVSWNAEKEKWRSAIYHAGRTRFLGYFTTEEEAAAAYDREARKIHGEFARVNLPESLSV